MGLTAGCVFAYFWGMDKKIDDNVIRRRRRNRWLKICGAVAVAAGVVMVLTALFQKGIKRSDLVIAEVDRAEMETAVPASGRVVPAYEEVINSPVNTRLLAVYAMAGDSVRRGDPLLELDLETEQVNYEKMVDNHRISQQEMTQLQLQSRTALSELQMQISVKEMEVSRRRVDLENERRLDSLGSGTGDRVRSAETALRTAELELEQLRQRHVNERLRSEAAEQVQALNVSTIEKDLGIMQSTLQRGRITAPHDGILTFIVNEIGSQVSAGQKVAVVSNLSAFKVMGEIAEGLGDRIAVGSRVVVRIGRAEIEGTVTNITPQSKGGVIAFVVNPDDPRHERLRSGVRAELYVACGFRDSAVRIPTGAYYKGKGDYNLFVVDGDNRLLRRKVKLGDGNQTHVEVVSGLAPGDRVVISDMSDYEKYSKLKIK